ncbi:MAG: hypothetical protein ACYC8S_02160 [Minisyncoccota bacterium]
MSTKLRTFGRIALVALLVVELGVASFGFAQTTNTTPPPDPNQQSTDPQSQALQDLVDSYQNNIPTPGQIKAQSTAGSVQLTTDPQAPGPNQSVTANVVSYLTNLDVARITWSLNGRIQKNGTGIRSFGFTTGPFGSVTTVSVSGVTAEGISFSKTVTFRPLDIDLSWEANTYTPPFYRGKALPTAGSGVRVVARLVGSAGDPSTLLYQWRKDGVVLGTSSGYGRTVLDIPRAFAGSGSTNIGVTISSKSGVVVATKYITLRAQSPRITFYENRPLVGVLYNTTLDSDVTAQGSEFAVRVEPYFVPEIDKLSGDILYRFNVDGNPLLTQARASATGDDLFAEYGPNQVTLINNGVAKKNVTLGIEVEDRGITIGNGQTSLNLILGGKDSEVSF